MPLSTTSMLRRSPRRRQPTTTPPRSVYLTALDTRLRRTRSSRIGSLRTQASFESTRRLSPFSPAGAKNVASMRLSKRSDREFSNTGLEDTGIELGDIQQRVEQLVHRRNGTADLTDQALLLGIGDIGAQLIGKQVERMQRLAQVVARRSQKPRLREIRKLQLLRSLLDLALQRGIGLLQSRRHVVELIAQRLKLVAGLDIDPVIEGAGPDPGCAGFAAPGWVLSACGLETGWPAPPG